jgi:hypothetical protein
MPGGVGYLGMGMYVTVFGKAWACTPDNVNQAVGNVAGQSRVKVRATYAGVLFPDMPST